MISSSEPDKQCHDCCGLCRECEELVPCHVDCERHRQAHHPPPHGSDMQGPLCSNWLTPCLALDCPPYRGIIRPTIRDILRTIIFCAGKIKARHRVYARGRWFHKQRLRLTPTSHILKPLNKCAPPSKVSSRWP